MKNKRWTEEENNRLIALIEENPHNIREALRRFIAECPERILSNVQYKWY